MSNEYNNENLIVSFVAKTFSRDFVTTRGIVF